MKLQRGTGFTGLCDSCVHQQLVTTQRSIFSLCRRSLTDRRFAKYPPIPVRSCAGHERVDAPGG